MARTILPVRSARLASAASDPSRWEKREGSGPDDDFEFHESGDEGYGPSGDIQGKIRMFTPLADFVERRL